MAGASIKGEWDAQDLRQVNEVLERIIRETDDLTPLFQDIGEYLLPAHQDRIAAGVDPDGVPLEPLSERYLASRRKQSSRGSDAILVLDDYLRGDLAYQATEDGLELGSNAIYAATHQFGRDGIPARPFLGFSLADIDEIDAIAGDFLDDILNG